ncbi:hypothetical protein [Croceicoccus sediminis]|uniref:hypothetical protein n=1 Tax=Croceicoccus sediminis TaxID=2571150 RepID=UPI00118390CD|nr:hypothetical protein [Croceicoccus sediminis]
MRIAVLSMLEPLAVDGLLTRAGLRVGGEAVVERQLELAEATGAQRILLLADRRTVGLDDVVARASEMKLEARVIADAPALCSEVTAADELVVFGDALLADPVLAVPLLNQSGIATLPVEAGLEAGFERIDAELAWAGLLVIPGALAERLRQLPRDCDVASSLLRIALMAGVTQRSVEPQALQDRRWVIVRSESEGQAIEAHRLRLSLSEARGRTPGAKIAGLVVGKFGNRLFEADRSAILVWWAAILPAAAAVAFAGFAMFAAAFFAIAVTWLVVRGAIILDKAERQGRIDAAMPDSRPVYVHLAIDILLLVVLALSLTGGIEGERLGALGPWFVATVFVCLVRLGAVLFPVAHARPFFEDRMTHCLVLGLAVLGGWTAPVVMAVSMAVMAGWAAFATFRANQVTR